MAVMSKAGGTLLSLPIIIHAKPGVFVFRFLASLGSLRTLEKRCSNLIEIISVRKCLTCKFARVEHVEFRESIEGTIRRKVGFKFYKLVSLSLLSGF